jgi:hypothetical protein
MIEHPALATTQEITDLLAQQARVVCSVSGGAER